MKKLQHHKKSDTIEKLIKRNILGRRTMFVLPAQLALHA
jgi:hypothetical protein